jgi:hypothetical protein
MKALLTTHNTESPMFRRFNPIILLAVASCATTNYGGDRQPPITQMTGTPNEPESHLGVDADRREVVVVAGPFHVGQTVLNQAGHMEHRGQGGHDSSMRTPLIPVVWPVDGGLRGFRLGIFSGDGTPLPRTLIHHLNALSFDRRELLYPVPTRLIAIGSMTPDIKVPNSYQVLLERGDNLGWYVMWNNDTGKDIENVYVELVLPYGKRAAARSPHFTWTRTWKLVMKRPSMSRPVASRSRTNLNSPPPGSSSPRGGTYTTTA